MIGQCGCQNSKYRLTNFSIREGVKRKFKFCDTCSCSGGLICKDRAFPNIASTTAADCRLGGSQSPTYDHPVIGCSAPYMGTSPKGLLRNRNRFSSSNNDQSIASSSKASEGALPLSLIFPKISITSDELEAACAFLKLKIFLRSCEEGKRKHSMKLAVPEFSRKFIDPLSD